MKINNSYSLGFIFILPLLLAACGFTVRPINHLATTLPQLTLSAADPYDAFTLQLKSRLEQYGVIVVESRPAKNLVAGDTQRLNTLVISKPIFTSAATSISLSTKARVYSLKLETTITLHATNHTAAGKTTKQKVQVVRSITLGPNEIYAASNQVPITRQEMEAELVDRVINVLTAIYEINTTTAATPSKK